MIPFAYANGTDSNIPYDRNHGKIAAIGNQRAANVVTNVPRTACCYPRNPRFCVGNLLRFGNTVVKRFAGSPYHAASVAPY